jgi:Aminotransferase class I and II
MVSARHLRALYGTIEQAGHWLVVDKAFIDFCPGHSLITDISNSTRLLILRSFTKFYGMPGIRLGYLAGSPDTMATIRRLLAPWSVSHVVQVAGMAALNDLPYRQRSMKFATGTKTVYGPVADGPQLAGPPHIGEFYYGGIAIGICDGKSCFTTRPSRDAGSGLPDVFGDLSARRSDCHRHPPDNNRIVHALQEALQPA